MELWKPQTIREGILYRTQIGPLVLWLKKNGDELHIARQSEPENDARTASQPLTACDTAPDNLEFSRWIVGAQANCLRFLPTLPDRPVVVRMEMPVNLPPRQQAIFFVSIPAWIRIFAEQQPPVELCEIPTVTRSNSWFGDTVSGRLCYSLITHARRDISTKKTERYRLVCPVEIRNNAKTLLNVDHLCLNVEHLNIYEGKPRLWTGPIQISYLGPDKDNQVDYPAETPAYEPELVLLSTAREPYKKTLLMQSLSSFKFIPGL